MGKISSREALLKIIYENVFESSRKFAGNFNLIENDSEESKEFIVENSLEVNDLIYIKDMLNFIVENHNIILEKIEQNSVSYKLERLYKIDLSILILAIAEYLKNEINEKIIVNEAVELSKKYSTDASYKYINGILASVIKEGHND